MQIIGDDFLVTNAARVQVAAASGACNAVLIKPNQAGTVTEAKAALDAGKRAGWGTIVSARSGETEDVTIVHLAAGWDAGQLKVGSFARSERMAKWNEALRIEEPLGSMSSFAGRSVLPKGRELTNQGAKLDGSILRFSENWRLFSRSVVFPPCPPWFAFGLRFR